MINLSQHNHVSWFYLLLAWFLPINLIQASNLDSTIINKSRGVLTAKHQTLISTPIGGVLTSLKSNTLSQSINEGDVIATINCDVLNAQLSAAKSNAAKASQETKIVKFEHEYTVNGQPMPIASEHSFKAALHAENALWADVNAKKAQLEQCTIKAPFAGVAANIFAKQGQFLKAGEPIIELVNNSTLLVEFNPPAWEWDTFKPGNQTMITIMPDSAIERSATIAITQRGAAFDAKGRFSVRGKIIEKQDELVSGMPFVVEHNSNRHGNNE